ncbi:hypothetical protein L2E82_29208 [Cichorium intybus]|uniref:Uncharacterized protein n=1 Tax=Cichorium intybus TaxID=13427 RepID=A0ACB9CXE9_CICIN|nr:hypothetical protein L2E82_29208 [Cichorium intybus]
MSEIIEIPTTSFGGNSTTRRRRQQHHPSLLTRRRSLITRCRRHWREISTINNLAGTGIGSFNDRIRDALLGGSPFGHPLQHGFLTGLSLQPNGHDHGTEANAARVLVVSNDHIHRCLLLLLSRITVLIC